MDTPLGRHFQVGNFHADTDLNTLTLHGDVQIVEPRVMEVLVYLAARQDQVISRYELMDEIWRSNVSDGAISRVIGLLRKALGDNAEEPAYIQTVAKKGYRLIASVHAGAPEGEESDLSPSDAAPADMAEPAPPAPQESNRRAPHKPAALWAAAGAFLVVMATLIAQQWEDASAPAPLLTGKPRFVQLTSDPGYEYDATLSPNEDWLLYRHRDSASAPYNLYVKIRSTGAVVQLTDDDKRTYSPAFSRDGRRIAYFSKADNHCRLIMLTLDSGARLLGREELYQCGAYDHYSNVAWAPDGQSVYFTDRANAQVPYQIYRLRLATKRLEAITQGRDTYYGDNELALSPSGRYLAFFRNKYWGNNEVYVLDLETREERKLLELGFLAWNISWTADEQHLLYSDNRNGGELKAIDVATGAVSSLYYSPQSIMSPELSASGRSIIYATELADVDLWERPLLALDAEPVKMDVSSSRIDTQPVSSPDGTRTLFLSDRNGGMQLWLRLQNEILPIGGLQTDAKIDRYAWHPDGRRAVVATSDKQLYILDTDTDRVEPLDIDHTAVGFPAFSENGDRLYFTSDKSGDWQLWALDMASLESRQLTERGGYQAQRGRHVGELYFTKFRQSGIWHLNLETGAERQVLETAQRSTPFTICGDALYHQRKAGPISLMRRDLISGESQALLTVPRNAKPWFDISPRCDRLTFSHYENIQSDIMELVLK